MRKSSGPRTEPLGTPCLTFNFSESMPFMETYWDRLDRYDLNHWLEGPRIP